MTMKAIIEAKVHTSLRALLRETESVRWLHHLTMARLVARALRNDRHALIQTGSSQERYCLSYLTPALLWSEPVILVTPQRSHQRLGKSIQWLQEWLETDKPIEIGSHFPDTDNFQGLILTTPQAWLSDRLENQKRFPQHIPTIIDRADELEDWTREQLTISIQPQDWDALMSQYPRQQEEIRDLRVQLTKAIFGHPQNPYCSCLLSAPEQKILQQLFQTLSQDPQWHSHTGVVRDYQVQFQQPGQMLWASIARDLGQFTLHIAPLEVSTALQSIWSQQPVVLIGCPLDRERSAPIYRQKLGLPELTTLKFAPDRQNEYIRLYLPYRLPMPNTPGFQNALLPQIHTLVRICPSANQPIVLLIDDVPLKAQIGANIAGEFGSRVQVEKINLPVNGILVTGWEFWIANQDLFPPPQLLVIATLPIPSLENPLVAAQVTALKSQRLNWFESYLLPTALHQLQRAIVPLRESRGVVALLDNRVNFRSYGKKILTALEPFARINYLDASWFESSS
ncbi:MAG: ATP-dependent DNA helicase [Oscillatoria sp. PMC 1051.18]|nr:ATP-dependent DNA helicase [Oscillatoria sp. PMC 1050.18]MEC5029988.1 ATP-dependent DNA helicase [Oscillatoria sp. PMC 1051.18]